MYSLNLIDYTEYEPCYVIKRNKICYGYQLANLTSENDWALTRTLLQLVMHVFKHFPTKDNKKENGILRKAVNSEYI